MAMDRQSEWIVLRRMLVFLKSRKLHQAAYALEKEARLKLDLPHLHKLFAKGRWWATDEYVMAFMSGKETMMPSVSAMLFIVRFERFVRVLRRGDEAWAVRYFCRAIRPLMSSHPDEAAASAECNRAMDHDSLHRNYPDDAVYRDQHLDDFYRCVYQHEHISLSFNDIFDTNLRFMRGTAAIGLRRHAHYLRRPARPTA